MQAEFEENTESTHKMLMMTQEKNECAMEEIFSLRKQINSLNEEHQKLIVEKKSIMQRETFAKKETASAIINLSNEIKKLSNKNELLSKENEINCRKNTLMKSKLETTQIINSSSISKFDANFKIRKEEEDTSSASINYLINNKEKPELFDHSYSSLNNSYRQWKGSEDQELKAYQVRKTTYKRKIVTKPICFRTDKVGYTFGENNDGSRIEDYFIEESNIPVKPKLSISNISVDELSNSPNKGISHIKSDDESLCNYRMKQVSTEQLANFNNIKMSNTYKLSIMKGNDKQATYSANEMRANLSDYLTICHELSFEISSSLYSDSSFFSRLFDMCKLNYKNPDHFILISKSRLYTKAKDKRVPFHKFAEFIKSEVDTTLETLNIKKVVSSNMNQSILNGRNRQTSNKSLINLPKSKDKRDCNKLEKSLAFFSQSFV